MRYELAPDLQAIANEISIILFPHIDVNRVKCFRGYGSASKNTIARCHTIGKLIQQALGIKAHYVLEFLSENFDHLDENEKVKIILHELMHIPKTFGGGFKHHNFVCDKNINLFYEKYQNYKTKENENSLQKEEY
jgi:predicted metallopeptidase